MLVLKEEASDSHTQLLACQKDLNIPEKETHEALDVVRTGVNGHDKLKVQLGQRAARYLKTKQAAIARINQPWLEERTVLVERLESPEAQHVQLRRGQQKECVCNGEGSTQDGDAVKATEVLTGHFEDQAEILRRRIAFLDSEEDIVIETHPVHQQIKAGLMESSSRTSLCRRKLRR